MKKKTAAMVFIVAVSLTLIFSGCKKNSNNNVVGNWQFKSYTVSNLFYRAISNDSITSTSTYYPQIKAVLNITRHSSPFYLDSSSYSFVYSTWNIKSDGTYTITENADTLTTTTTSTWEYLSNSTSNNAIMFENAGSILIPATSINGLISSPQFNIKTVTANQLILGYTSSASYSSGDFSTGTTTITFTK